MARAGGSRSGGSRSGGSRSSSSRSSSSRSGGSRSSSSRSSSRSGGSRSGSPRSSSRGGGSSYQRGQSFGDLHRGRPYTGSYGGGGAYRRRSKGCLTATIVPIIVVVFCVMSLFNSIRWSSTSMLRGWTKSNAGNVVIEPLDASATQKTAYFKDELGWIGDGETLEEGLSRFYAVTGVQPYIYLTDKGLDLEDADDLYSQLFSDEGHFLFVINGSYDEDQNENWDLVYLLGEDAADVIDDSVLEILWNYYDSYYEDSSLNDEEMLSQTFGNTAAALTVGEGTVKPEEKTFPKEFLWLVIIILCIIALIIAPVLVMIHILRKNEKENAGSYASPDISSADDFSKWYESTHGSGSGTEEGGYILNGEFKKYDE